MLFVCHPKLFSVSFRALGEGRGRGGGGGIPYISDLYRYVPPHRVEFLRRFGLKTGNTLPILVWNRVWFSKELQRVYERNYRFNPACPIDDNRS